MNQNERQYSQRLSDMAPGVIYQQFHSNHPIKKGMAMKNLVLKMHSH